MVLVTPLVGSGLEHRVPEPSRLAQVPPSNRWQDADSDLLMQWSHLFIQHSCPMRDEDMSLNSLTFCPTNAYRKWYISRQYKRAWMS